MYISDRCNITVYRKEKRKIIIVVTRKQIFAAKLNKNFRSITEAVLEITFDISKSVDDFPLSRKKVFGALHGNFGDKWAAKRGSRTISDLVSRGYFESSHDGKSVRFTNKAKIKIIDKISNKTRSDGKDRLVSFDIPEKLKDKRDSFRLMLKRMGFKQIQKSLWVCDKNIGYLVEMVSEEFGVNDYVVYVVVERTNIDETIDEMLSKKI